jgi:hypothetical protein
MRIACIHIPQFALQSATRVDPVLRGAAVAVVSGVSSAGVGGAGQLRGAGVLHAPIVLACSRLAWSYGVRLGMTATAARAQSPETLIVTADAANERETVRAIADTLLGVSPTVDVGGRVGAGGAHLAMYVEVPAKTRGAAFGDKLVELIDELGLTARIGIADDRFTAWVAASQLGHTGAHAGADEHGVVAVPRGGSAAFLAPRPLSLLAISPEVQHMLEALGVRTLGEFAALPAPSIARPLEADYRALARGESDATLRPYTPDAPIREEVTVSASNVLELQDLLPAGEHAAGLSLGAATLLLARRLELRLTGRGRGAARLDITVSVPGGLSERNGVGEERELPLTLERGLGDAEQLAHMISAALDAHDHSATDDAKGQLALASSVDSPWPAKALDTWRLRVVVAGEVILGGAGAIGTEIFAEGSSRYTPSGLYAVPADAYEQSAPADGDRRSADHQRTDTDRLGLVLSSSGSLFALSTPSVGALRAERRDAHRRTRRGKQRRARPTPHAQPRLFDRVSSKS